MLILGLLAVVVALVLIMLAWMAISLLMLVRRIGEPGRRPRRSSSDGPPPAIH